MKKWSFGRNINAILTDRHGGVGTGEFASNNMALHVGDNPTHVFKNRKRLLQVIKLPVNSLVFMNQVHGNNVTVVEYLPVKHQYAMLWSQTRKK